MPKSLLLDLGKLLFFFGILWAGFALWSPDFGWTDDVSILSIDQEEKLGELIIENFLESDPSFQSINNPKVDSAMNIINTRLLDNIGLTDYDYNIVVVDNALINAVTLPGANIFVFKGLIEFTEAPEELAAVIAHEIGHAEKRHVVDQLMREFGILLLTSILTGENTVLISELSQTLVSKSFGRSQEAEADEFSLDLLEKSSISPTAMASFFRRLNRESADLVEMPEVLMTHPHNNSRIKKSMEYKTKNGFEAKPIIDDWAAVKEAL